MSVKGEKYKSPAMKKKHESSEGAKERKMEYGKKPAKKNKVALVMGEFKRGTLHGGIDPKGPKKAPVVKSRSQAIAIALAKARKKK